MWYRRLTNLLPAPVAAAIDAAADRWQRSPDPLRLRAVKDALVDAAVLSAAVVGVAVLMAVYLGAEFCT